MNNSLIRILFIADTHLGFDLPFRPRIIRRRRGQDFFANFERALVPALNNEVDCVLHGGDLLYRSKVPARLVEMVFEPLKHIAQNGIPVYLVPGNHERSAIPHRMCADHPNIHIFDHPRTFSLQIRGITLALAGFPFVRYGIRKDFKDTLDQTGWHKSKADGYILCLHQCIEGASVGPANFTFRDQHDVIKMADIPPGFMAVLTGHIHRFQVLTKNLKGQPSSAPVLYPGSIEKTSFAEKDEKKGFLMLEIERSYRFGCQLKHWCFHELPSRPMAVVDLHVAGMSARALKSWIKSIFQELSADSVVKIKIHGRISEEARPVLAAASLRSLAPPTVNVSVYLVDETRHAHPNLRIHS
jgi:exonuclease SbcD